MSAPMVTIRHVYGRQVIDIQDGADKISITNTPGSTIGETLRRIAAQRREQAQELIREADLLAAAAAGRN